jgi:hypothetical protein
LSYQRGSHYNSIVDPYKATIGVGLGLPSYTPGLAEKNLMNEAVSQSEHFQVEQVCFLFTTVCFTSGHYFVAAYSSKAQFYSSSSLHGLG